MTRVAALAAALLACVARAQDEGAAPPTPAAAPIAIDRAHIVVQKTLSAPETQHYLVQNKPFTVTYMVLNVGEGTAYNVSLRDDWPAEAFKIIDGTSTRTFDAMPSGANQTFALTLSASASGTMTSARATVEYKYANPHYEPAENLDGDDEDDDAYIPVTSSSTTPGRVDIITQETYDRIAAANNQNYVYVTVGAALVAVVVPWALSFSARSEVAALTARSKSA